VDFQKSMMDKSELYAIRAKSDISQGFEVGDISMMDKSELYAIRAKSDISQGFEVGDIFT